MTVDIQAVLPGSIADELSLRPGDRVVAVNGQSVRDFLDVLIAEKNDTVDMLVEKADGEIWQLEIEKEPDSRFGLELAHPEPARCGNNCIFCFVHQLPKGMRRTLYVKDEDYRFSYLYGAYVTLSNIVDADLKRIVEQDLSPLYVSVHAVDETVRNRLLGRTVPPILPLLQQLVEAGIVLHTQVVVCPGINDGAVLDETVEQLANLHPGVASLALVPVGLTRHREHLEHLQPVSASVATRVLDSLAAWQTAYRSRLGSRFVFAADEFYLRANRPFPELDAYENLPQLENGVGMTALFRDDAREVLDEARTLHCPVAFSVVTGKAFGPELSLFLSSLSGALGCEPRVFEIDNRLFGSSVTVAGLVSGQDIANQLQGENLGSALLVPDVMIRDRDSCFLDDLRPDDLEMRLGCKVIVVETSPWGILEAVEELAGQATTFQDRDGRD